MLIHLFNYLYPIKVTLFWNLEPSILKYNGLKLTRCRIYMNNIKKINLLYGIYHTLIHTNDDYQIWGSSKAGANHVIRHKLIELFFYKLKLI